MFVRLSSCWLLWLRGWENVLHEDMPREVQEIGELPSGRGPQTEGRIASTKVSTTHLIMTYVFIHQLPRDRFPVLLLSSRGPQSEMSDPDAPSFETMFQPAEAPGQMPAQARYNEYGYNQEAPTQMGRADDFSGPGTTESYCISFLNTM